jgi:hypothetical protein
MMLADAENIEPNLIGEFDLFQQVLHALHRSERKPVAGSEIAAAKLSIPISICVSWRARF